MVLDGSFSGEFIAQDLLRNTEDPEALFKDIPSRERRGRPQHSRVQRTERTRLVSRVELVVGPLTSKQELEPRIVIAQRGDLAQKCDVTVHGVTHQCCDREPGPL